VRAWWGVWVLVGCAGSESLVIPDVPGASGMPVGSRTFTFDDQVVEVWYPASDRATGEPSVTDLAEFLPPEFLERVAGLTVPTLQTGALREAEARRVDDALPVLLFSHGLGAFRTQSANLTTHLASHGYVVVAVDHPGRMLGDVAPCLFSPPAGNCAIGGLVAGDPGPEDLAAALAWLDEGGLDELELPIDLDQLGVLGHSMGGGSTVAFTNAETRVEAAFAMAGASDFTRSVPSAVLAGACDGVVTEADLAASGPSTTDDAWTMPQVGHMAFADLCDVDLGALATEIGERDDASDFFVDMLTTLATDGCAPYPPLEEVACTGAFRPVAETYVEIRAAATVFFDQHLRGAEDSLATAGLPGLERLEP
jgi:dienelactone hydrolase